MGVYDLNFWLWVLCHLLVNSKILPVLMFFNMLYREIGVWNFCRSYVLFLVYDILLVRLLNVVVL